MPFVRHDREPTGAWRFEREDGTTFVAPDGPAARLEARRMDLLAQAGAGGATYGIPDEYYGRAADPGSGTRQPVTPPSRLDAGQGGAPGHDGGASGGQPRPEAPYTPAPPPTAGYSAAPPREEPVTREPAGQGGAPGAYGGQGQGAAGGAGPVPVYAPDAPPDGGGGAQGAPGAEPAATGQGQAPAPAAPGAPGAPGAVRFSGPPKPASARGGGGGGPARPAGPKEMLVGRTVQIEGRLSPARLREQEDLARREGELAGRGLVRQEERTEKDRLEEERQETLAEDFDQRTREAQQEGQRALDELAERRAAKLKEIEETQLDGAALWKGGRGTQNQIAAGLAVALGAVGAAIAGGPNAGLAAVERAIDRDLNLQEKDLDKKRADLGEIGRIYAFEKERLGDKIAARNEAKIAALTAARARAGRLARMSNAEDAMINLQRIELETDKKIAGLRAENEGRVKEAQQFKTIMPATGGPVKKTTGGVTIMRPDGKGGYKAVYLPFPPGLSDGQKSEFMKRAQGANKALQSLRDIKEKRGSGVPVNDEDVQAFAQSYTYRYAEAEGQGQATADQEKSVADKIRSSLGGGGRAIEAYERSIDQVGEEIIRQLLPPAPEE